LGLAVLFYLSGHIPLKIQVHHNINCNSYPYNSIIPLSREFGRLTSVSFLN
jgi:hypothetical protein